MIIGAANALAATARVVAARNWRRVRVDADFAGGVGMALTFKGWVVAPRRSVGEKS
jgi:hypothetical protein